MNYFGLFFSFMIPGIILGCWPWLLREAEQGRRRKAARRRQGSGRSAQSVGPGRSKPVCGRPFPQEPSHSRAA